MFRMYSLPSNWRESFSRRWIASNSTTSQRKEVVKRSFRARSSIFISIRQQLQAIWPWVFSSSSTSIKGPKFVAHGITQSSKWRNEVWDQHTLWSTSCIRLILRPRCFLLTLKTSSIAFTRWTACSRASIERVQFHISTRASTASVSAFLPQSIRYRPTSSLFSTWASPWFQSTLDQRSHRNWPSSTARSTK